MSRYFNSIAIEITAIVSILSVIVQRRPDTSFVFNLRTSTSKTPNLSARCLDCYHNSYLSFNSLNLTENSVRGSSIIFQFRSLINLISVNNLARSFTQLTKVHVIHIPHSSDPFFCPPPPWRGGQPP